MYLIASFLIISMIFSLKRKLNLSYSQSPIIIISVIIVFFYLSALNESLNLGYFIFCIIGLFSIFSNTFYFKKNKSHFYGKEENVITSFFSFCFLLSTFSLFVKFGIWDEFSHWAPQIKYIYLNNLLRNEFVEFGAASYPVGSALFYLIFLKYSTFNEGVVYFSHSLLILLPLACFIDSKESIWQKTILKTFILIIFLTIFGVRLGPIGSIYMDQVVAIFFGCTLVYYVNSKKTFGEIFLIVFILIAFLQLKDSLLAFAFLIIGFIAIDQGFLFVQKKSNLALKQILFLLSVLFIFSFLSLKTWEHYLGSINIQRTWNINQNLFEIISITLFPTEEYNKLILNNFIDKFYEPYVIPNQVSDNLLKYFPMIKWVLNLSPFQFLINQFILILFIFSLNKKLSINVILHNLVLLFGYILYLYGLLILYNFSFGDYEGPRLASFERYQSIFQIGWILFNLNYIFQSKFFQNLDFSKFLLKFSWIPIFIFIVSLSILKIYIDNFTERGQFRVQELHNRIQIFTQEVQKLTEENSKIKVVWQSSNGLELGIIRYNLIPRFVRGGSFGIKYNENDVWTNSISKDEFFDDLKQFDYLLLAFTDSNFWSLYGDIFSEVNLNSDILIEYSLCKGEFAGFHSLSLGCQDSIEKAYLFQIKNENEEISLIPIRK